MNAETLGALANIVNEAIAKAVQPLQQRIAELEGRKGYDDTPLRQMIQKLEDRQTPQSYDDSDLRQELARVSKNAAEAYNDYPVLQRLEALEGRKEYDDSELREQVKTLVSSHAKDVEALLQRIPKAYDDAPLRQEISEAIKFCTSAQDDLLAHIKRLDERPAPAPGADGKDALALEILPEIDQAKSYVRNTYAKHNGGLWRSFEQTHGMRGWECIVDGVHAVMPVLEGKSLTVRVIQSSGTESVLTAELPIQEYKGVFRPDGEYVAHDTATWAGSLWHCNVTGTKAKPGDGSSDWTLAVKKGRDARETVKIGG